MTYTQSTPSRPKNRAAKRALAATLAAALTVGSLAAASAASANETTGDWSVSTETLNTGVANGYQLAYANGNVYVADAQWRAERRIVGTPENTPMESGSSMRTSFSPYGVAVDADVDGEAVVVTTTARQRDEATGFGGGVVIYKASQGEPSDADRVFEYADGSPIFSGPRRVAVNAQKNLAFVTNLGDSRGASERQGYITVLDLTKRGAAAVVAQVTVPDAAGSVGVSVDEANDLIYVGSMAGEKLYVIDGSKIDASAPADFQLNNGAISAVDAVVGGNARPTYNADLKKVYVSAYDDSTITVVEADPASADYGKAVKVIDVRTGPEENNKGTNAVEVDAARGLLYSANLDSGVSVYDINNDYEQIEFTATDGTKYRDIVTGDRVVNFGINEATGELWASTWSSAGKVHVFNINKTEAVEGNEVGTSTFAALQDSNATVTFSNEWVIGEPLTITGQGWNAQQAGFGSRLALKLDGGSTSRPFGDIISEPEEAPDESVWHMFDAKGDGTFEIEIPFPTANNSVIANPNLARWEDNTQHRINILGGSLGLGTEHQSIARGAGGQTANIKVVAQSSAVEASEEAWTATFSSLDTGVKNGYQLAYANGKVYVADAQWTTAAAIGTGKVVQFDAASKTLEANHDFTKLRRNDGISYGQLTTAPSGKVVQFSAADKAITATHDFTGLTRNDGSGADSDPFSWDGVTASSQTSMRSTFSPYGIAVDADVDGEAVVVTTTARQRDEATGFGGGVVIYKASQGAPTDADRVFNYADGSPIFSGPRRVAVNSATNQAFVTSLGDSRGGSERQGYITVLDLTKRGAEAVVAQVTVPDAAGAVGVAVDEVNNLIYVGGYALNGIEKLYVIDGSKIDASAPADFQLNNGAISALDAVVGANARPTYNADLKKVYVSAYDASTITVVEADPVSADYGKALKVIDVRSGADSANKGTNAVEVDAQRGLLYSANLDAGVSVYDINNDYEQIEFTAADGSKFKDVPTSGRSVNFGLDAETGEIWVSTWSSAGTVDIVRVTAPDEVDPEDQVDPAEPEISVVGQLIPGGAITVRGAGFEAGASARVELHSDPVALGTVIVSAEGTFELAASIPSDLEPGNHTVYVFVNDSVVAERGILVADPDASVDPTDPTEPGQTDGSDTPAQPVTSGDGAMPNTGGDIVNSTVIIAIALMLALGAGMVVLRRFQNREEAND